jgi:hypothetical protein
VYSTGEVSWPIRITAIRPIRWGMMNNFSAVIWSRMRCPIKLIRILWRCMIYDVIRDCKNRHVRERNWTYLPFIKKVAPKPKLISIIFCFLLPDKTPAYIFIFAPSKVILRKMNDKISRKRYIWKNLIIDLTLFVRWLGLHVFFRKKC